MSLKSSSLHILTFFQKKISAYQLLHVKTIRKLQQTYFNSDLYAIIIMMKELTHPL